MNLDVRVLEGVVIIKLRERRLVFPRLESFTSAVKEHLAKAPRHLILNLSIGSRRSAVSP